jgi:diaminopimelate decarboxylase
MHHFEYQNKELHCEGVPLSRIAEEVGTPTYVYSHATLTRHFNAFDHAFQDMPHFICYSVKANSNLSLLRLFANMGGGADIVSGGELYRALKAGVPADRIVFSGVGKTAEEMKDAIEAGILMFSVESDQELTLLNETATSMGKKARVSLRVNPDVDPQTHPYISTGLRQNKFGVPIDKALSEYKRAAAMDNLEVIGVNCHIGSQLTTVSPFVDAVARLRNLLDQLKAEGIAIKYLDLGGGLGITYDAEKPPEPSEYAKALKEALAGLDLTVVLEPGRVIVGNAGILMARVLYIKDGPDKSFVVTDGAMNDLMRPALYGSYHVIRPVSQKEGEAINVDVVGPICESSDFLAKDRQSPRYEQGDLLAVMSAGAYGFSMSSNYNSRRRAAEVLVKDDGYHIVRARENYDDLIRGENLPDYLK